MRTIFIILGLLFCSIKTFCQTNPQYEFYSNYDISTLTGGVKNCVDEAECIEYALKLYDIIKEDSISEGNKFMAQLYAGLICHNNKGKIESASDLESVIVKVAYMNDRQRIDLLARLYDIEKTCYIKYTTTDGNELNFKTDKNNEANARNVDFGARLISNTKDKDDFLYLKFADQITDIDANLFSEDVSSIVLPSSKKLRYLNNARKDISKLKYIEGYDVKNNLLIDSDSTLIVAAIWGVSEFCVPKSVKVLGEDCFRGCKIERIYIPSSVMSIKSGAFDKCTELKNIVLEGEQVLNIDVNALYKSSINMLNIYVPKKTYKLYKKQYPLLKKQFAVLK